MSVDWKNPFKPEDFETLEGFKPGDSRCAAEFSNRRFRELLSQAPVVCQTDEVTGKEITRRGCIIWFEEVKND